MNERALSLRQAFNCEMAVESRCRCRCNGAAHGRSKGYGLIVVSSGPGFREDGEFAGGAEHRIIVAQQLARLPDDDPHHIPLHIEAHPLGPMRKVIKKEKKSTRWPYGIRKDVGNWY